MPTSRPRHQVTETAAVQHALDLAAQRWPGEPRSKLLVRLVRAGGAVLQRETGDAERNRRAVVDASSGKYAGAYGEGYLVELRRDWPA
jgi:non-ribosomal peptide synthetase component E (peptide arylation enzyme)